MLLSFLVTGFYAFLIYKVIQPISLLIELTSLMYITLIFCLLQIVVISVYLYVEMKISLVTFYNLPFCVQNLICDPFENAFHEDLAWRLASLELLVNITANVIQLLVMIFVQCLATNHPQHIIWPALVTLC
jgi:hypothetical protein